MHDVYLMHANAIIGRLYEDRNRAEGVGIDIQKLRYGAAGVLFRFAQLLAPDRYPHHLTAKGM